MDKINIEITNNNTTKMTFAEMELLPKIQSGLDKMGIYNPTEIQEKAIPVIRSGVDVIGRSQTGTGKTLAFTIPLLEAIEPANNKKSAPQALILCPTRELAQQVADVLKKLTKDADYFSIAEVYGGTSLDKQFAMLRKANIVIGTPGRVMDHMRRGTLFVNNIKMVVLDEADEMLSMGFKEDMETILKDTPIERQTILFSATMPQAILNITKEFQKKPQIVNTQKKEISVKNIEQSYVEVPSNQKIDSLSILLHYYEPTLAIIFCNTKSMVEEITAHLNTVGIEADGLHGDLRQSQRTNVMNRFKFGKTSILVATDVAARGLDVNDIEYVFNYDVPQNGEYYVHRIGRTGRVGKSGNAITLCTSRRQVNMLLDIASETKSKIKTIPLPKLSDVNKKSSIGSMAAMRRALSGSVHPKYEEMLEKLISEGHTLESIAISAMALSFSESDAIKSNLKDVQIRENSYDSSSRRGRSGSRNSRNEGRKSKYGEGREKSRNGNGAKSKNSKNSNKGKNESNKETRNVTKNQRTKRRNSK